MPVSRRCYATVSGDATLVPPSEEWALLCPLGEYIVAKGRLPVDAQGRSLVWTKRITWVTTPPGSVRVGTIIAGERLGKRVGCPRCQATSGATIWRRFDYFGPEHPVHFTKCRRCHRRTAVDPLEVASLLLDAGVPNPDCSLAL